MVKRQRRHLAASKFRIALEALEGSKTISQLSSEHEVHFNMIQAWKRQLLENGPRLFTTNGERKQQQHKNQVECNDNDKKNGENSEKSFYGGFGKEYGGVVSRTGVFLR